jgi:MerR family redox-sensitive transcriptional activator SoxR
MRIGELSRAARINPSAIRYYEQEGLIPRADRRAGRRVFDERSLDQLIVVRMAQEAGFSLAEVRQLVTEFGQDRWRRLAERKLVELEALAGRLRVMNSLLKKLLECECPSIEICGRALRQRSTRQFLNTPRAAGFSRGGGQTRGTPQEAAASPRGRCR